MNRIGALILRPGAAGAMAVRGDVLWLASLAALLIATGIGLRDPWPADEPRFALIARDMVATGQWLIPLVGGDVYADKPPLFFWLMAAGIAITGSVRWGFLLPSLLAGIGTVLLTYDLARRLWNRQAGMAAALALLFTVQFVWQARQAQIDATLCFFTTLSLYGLLRHCLIGPQWGWYAIGWAAAGFGIITKGVGFLPLLVLLPYALAARRGWQPRTGWERDWRWLLGPVALVAAISVWLVPMLWASATNPELRTYRDEILFTQTVTRYAEAWHHREPFWYFLLEVIPGLWLPLVALLPWLIPAWRSALRGRDLRVLVLLVWVAIVVLFFSFSTGKRGVYILPAVPALALAAGPMLTQLVQRRGPARTMFALACAIAPVACALGLWLVFDHDRRHSIEVQYGIDALLTLGVLGSTAVLTCLVCRSKLGFLAWSLVLTEVLMVISFQINPEIDRIRSSRDFMRRVEAMSEGRALGLVAYKEQFLLQARRPVTTFGHRREEPQEVADAALWLSQDGDRLLLIPEALMSECFAKANSRLVGLASRSRWHLLSGPVTVECAERGTAAAPIPYNPAHD